MTLTIKDVRAEMPNYPNYKDWQRSGPILGIAVHHSATADRTTGAPSGNARTFFEYHVNQRGWAHGGYNYVIGSNGEVEYALDDKIAAFHAGFADPDNSLGLEGGQYWNNHYLAVCLAGWFSHNRTYRDSTGRTQSIPNNFTSPSPAQMQSLLALLQQLRRKYGIPVDNVRAHRELAGNVTSCPGPQLDPAQIRAALRAADEAEPDPQPDPELPRQVHPGEHVLLLPDTDRYLNAAMAYIWKFEPDVSFAIDEASGRWPYVTIVGNPEIVSDEQLARLRLGGAKVVQRVAGDPGQAQTTLDRLVETGYRFLTKPDLPPGSWRTYTVQPGDTLSLIARQMYGQAQRWRIIFEANQDILADPGRLHPGQVLKIPPKPE